MSRSFAFFRRPQTIFAGILGGALLFSAQQGAEWYRFRLESADKELSEVRVQLADALVKLPDDSNSITLMIKKVRQLFTLYRSENARAAISLVLGELENSLSLSQERERLAAEAEASKKLAAQAQAESEAKQREAEQKATETQQQSDAAAENVARSVRDISKKLRRFPF
jgi:hypothetical protein